MDIIKIFYCYAREDEALLNKLKAHLRPLQRQGLIDDWHDREILPGMEWKREIDKHLNTSDIVLLLISPNFMGSDYCYSIEMRRALERHEKGEVHVIPVILRPVNWKETPIGKLQALPTDGKPIVSWPDRDEAFKVVVGGIGAVVSLVQKAKEEAFLSLVPQKAQVSVEADGKLIATYPLNKRSMTVGRDPRVDIYTEFPTVSSTHGIIRWIDGAWVFLDTGTTNGTFYEGKRLDRFALHIFAHGDRIYLGGDRLAIHFQLVSLT